MNIEIQQRAELKGHKGAIFSLSPANTPNTFLSGGGDGWVVAWNIDTPEEGKLIAKVPANVFSLQQIQQQNLIIAGDMYGGVHWINTNSPEKTKRFEHHKNGVFDILELNQDTLLTLGGDGILTQWSIDEQRPIASLKISSQSLRSIAYAKDRKELAIGTSDSNIYILDSETLAIKNTISKAHIPSVFSVHYSPDEKILLSGGRDAQLRGWHTETLEPAFQFDKSAHWYTINDLAIHPTAPLLATASRDKTIRIWNLNNFKLLKVLDLQKYKGHTHSVNAIFWSTYDNTLISASDDRNIILWKFNIKSE